jgi:predicted DNA-binding transcriptional regulator AlpA
MNHPDFLDIDAVRAKVGGSRPVAKCTVYRLIQRKLLPKPFRISGSSRWITAEVDAALRSLVEARRSTLAAQFHGGGGRFDHGL